MTKNLIQLYNTTLKMKQATTYASTTQKTDITQYFPSPPDIQPQTPPFSESLSHYRP